MRILKQSISYIGILIAAGDLVHYSIINQWQKYHWIILAVGVALIIAGIILNLREFVDFFKSRKGLYGLNSIASIIILLVVLALVNVVAVRHNKRLDTTPNKFYSLSPQTLKILHNLKKPIYTWAFTTDKMMSEKAKIIDLLKNYHANSALFHWKAIDPDRYPQKAKKYKIKAYNTVAVEYEGKVELVESPDEAKLTSSIIKVTRKGKKVIYFVTGHGERSIKDLNRGGFSKAENALKDSNYDVKEVNLIMEKGVPKDCTLLIIAGPRKEYFPKEIQWIENYAKKGGSVFVMVDPKPSAALKDLLKKWGIKPVDDLVLDTSGISQLLNTGPGVPLVTHYPAHPITKDMRAMSLYPLARSLEKILPSPKGVEIRPFLKTDPASWGETNLGMLSRTGQARFDEGIDIKGPLVIGYTSEREITSKEGKKKVKARLAVIGDSDFASNAYFRAQLNGDIFMNTVNWLTMEEDLISIRPKKQSDKRLFLTEANKKISFYSVVILFPLIPLIFGLVVIFGRRRKK